MPSDSDSVDLEGDVTLLSSSWLVGEGPSCWSRDPPLSSKVLGHSFPGSSAGKEFACNARDPSLIPRSGRSPEKGIGYLHQYSWASLVAQMVKNLPVVWEIWVRSLGWEDSLERGTATHSSILACRIPWTVESDTTEQLSLSLVP